MINRIKKFLLNKLRSYKKTGSALRHDFREIYLKNLFNGTESRSGEGSTIEQTKHIREELPTLLKKLNIKSFLDTPCGDFNWMQYVDLSGVKYIGGDIVPEIVSENNNKFKTSTHEFLVLDIIHDKLPKVDLIFCRDCLVHMSFYDIKKAIENFKKSGSKYLMTTTFTNRKANDDLHGIWRTLNLQISPFTFPKPEYLLNERCTEGNNKFTDKCLGIWKLQDL